MGVVFRNGRPFGAAKEDVTIVTNFEDLTNLPNKETNHLYVTTSDNTEYYWDVEKREFVPLSATFSIAADENEIVIGDGEGGVKPHSSWYAKTNDGTLIYDNSKTSVYQPVIISGKVEGTVHPLSSDIPRDSSQTYPDAEFTSVLPRLSLQKAHVNFSDAFVKVDTADVQISEGTVVNIDGQPFGPTSKTYTAKNEPRQVIAPQLLIHNNLVIEANPAVGTISGTYSAYQSPYIGINGPLCMDFNCQCGTSSSGGGPARDWTKRWHYTDASSIMRERHGCTTWIEGYDGAGYAVRGISGPYIKMAGNPSVNLDGAPNVHIMDRACIDMGQEGSVRLNEYALVDIDGTADIRIHNDHFTFLDGQSMFRMTHQSGVEITNDSIFITTVRDTSTKNWVSKPGGNQGGRTSTVWGAAAGAVLGQWGVSKVGVADSMFDDFCNAPSLFIGGSTIIETSDGGKNAFRFGGKGSLVYMVEPESKSKVLYKFAPQGIFNFTVQGNSDAETWFKYNPSNRVYVNIQPWKSMLVQVQPQEPWEIYFEGGPGLIQVQGASHIENHGGTHILRNNSNSEQNAAAWSHSQHYTSTGNLTFKTKNQYTAEDNLDALVADTADFLAFKDKLNENVPNTAYANKYRYDGGGKIVSSEPDYTEKVYATRIHGADGSYSGEFTTDWRTSARNSLFYYLKAGNKIPPNCADQGTGSYTYLYRYGNTYYYRADGIKYTHDGVEFKLNNEYPAETPLSSLSADDKEIIFGTFNQNISNAYVVASQVRSDMTYTTTVTGYKTIYGHDGRDWAEPVLPYDGNPVSQMYDESNFLMRAATIPYAAGQTTTTIRTSETDYEYTLIEFTGSGTTADPYLPYFETRKYYTKEDSGYYYVDNCPADWGTAQNKYYRKTTDQERYDKFMANTTDYNLFLARIAVPLETYENLQILGVSAYHEVTPFKYYITISWNATKKEAYSYLPPSNGSPIIEMVGTSELRLWDGTMIKAKQGTTEAEFTFSDGTTDVTFSISELANLKRMASATPTVVVDDSSEMTENDTLYFLNE